MDPPAAEAPAAKGVGAIGAGTPLTLPERTPRAVDTSFATLAKAEPITNQSDPVASGPDALWWLTVIVCGLIGIYAGGRLVFGPVEPFRR